MHRTCQVISGVIERLVGQGDRDSASHCGPLQVACEEVQFLNYPRHRRSAGMRHGRALSQSAPRPLLCHMLVSKPSFTDFSDGIVDGRPNPRRCDTFDGLR